MRISLLFTFIAVLAALVGASISFADEPNLAAPIVPTSSENEEAAESPANIEPEPTNLEIAEELPHEELDREEAGELLEGVFDPEVAGAAGIYSDLHVEKFLAPNVAVIAAGQQPEVVDGSRAEGPLEAGGSTGTTLMESTEPLATEGDLGKLEGLDLNLERAEGSLAPANAMVEVTVPSELGEGIELPGPGIEIEAEGVVESRAASTLGHSVAFYPNVSEETDLAVAPTLGGVETMTQLRSPESPNTESYKLILPVGSSLTKQGSGAIVTKGKETLMTVAPPTALDAEGTPVPVELSVEGDRLTIRVTPSATAVYPVLVDPLFQSFEWYARHHAQIAEGWGEGWEQEPEWEENVTGHSYYGESVQSPITSGSMSAFVPSGSYGLDTTAYGPSGPGAARYWIYHVPRYKRDKSERGGAVPETFISRMTTSDVAWRAESNALSPYMVMGLWGPSKGWASLYTHEGLSGHSINNLGFVYPFSNEQNVPDVKFALVGLVSNENVSVGNDELFVGAATIELSEPATSAPEFVSLSGPTEWLNTGKVYVKAQAKDAGLGVSAVTALSEAPGSPSAPWKASLECTGVALSPCPFNPRVFIGVEPERLPTGIDKLNVTAEDPIGRLSPVSHVEMAVDHTAPEVNISGSVTEQATLGTKRGSYSVKVQDADGTAAKPQSGVAKVFIEVDGSVLKGTEPGCPVENCSVPLEATIESQKYGAGEHTLKVRVVDAAGNPASVEQKFVLTPSLPSLTLSGSMTEQGVLGSGRPRYRLVLKSSAEAGVSTAPTAPAYVTSFGSAGTGNGQFSRPIDLARDAKGNLWVVDEGHGRIEEFGPAGAYLSQFGTEGSGQGQLKKPTAIAVGPEGDLWVADTGNRRIVEFNPQGQYLSSFGSSGVGKGKFEDPDGIAVDAGGDIWVADGSGKLLEEFGPGGNYLQTITGSVGAGRLYDPVGIAVGPEGNIWVADTGANKVDEFEPNGTFVTSFGEHGSANGDFSLSGSLAVDAHGDIWVGDALGERFEEFDSEGHYLARFGSKGSGEGQLNLAYGSAIAAGPTGRLWVVDTTNNRVEEWMPTETGSEITEEVDLDGQPVAYGEKACAAERCPFADEWKLESSTVAPGPHEVVITVSDGIGNSVTRRLPIGIQRDTTSPSLEVGGELANAPEGWVQQETYGVHASATDGGYGDTSLVFKIDGGTVGSETAACPEGGCGLSLAAQIDMAAYSGGAHEAEVVATDGAGNKSVKRWTINVDPEGRISTQEEAETLEAVEETSEQTPIAPTDQLLEPGQREAGDDPGLEVSGSEITSSGVPDVTTMTTDPEDGFSIQGPEGTTTITPVVSEDSSSVSVKNGVAGTASDVAKEVDSVIRPEYNGVQIAQVIRSESSPEVFSWRVKLAPRQELVSANKTQAEVIYSDGTEAFLITAEPAHDATGKPVPTSLEVHGDELTVRVEFHSGTFVYPVVAGEGWETSYESPVIVEGPEDETQIRVREEREQKEREEEEQRAREAAEAGVPLLSLEVAESVITPGGASSVQAPPPEPEPNKGTIATASSLRTFEIHVHSCSNWHLPGESGCEVYKIRLFNGKFLRWDDGAERLDLPHLKCEGEVPQPGWRLELHIDLSATDWHEPFVVHKGEGKQMVAYCHYGITLSPLADFGSLSGSFSLIDFVYANGFQEGVVKELAPKVLAD
jgi:streptogramin lyase